MISPAIDAAMSRPERGDGLKGAAILVADGKAVEQVLDGGQPDALKIRRTSGARRPSGTEAAYRAQVMLMISSKCWHEGEH